MTDDTRDLIATTRDEIATWDGDWMREQTLARDETPKGIAASLANLRKAQHGDWSAQRADQRAQDRYLAALAEDGPDAALACAKEEVARAAAEHATEHREAALAMLDACLQASQEGRLEDAIEAAEAAMAAERDYGGTCDLTGPLVQRLSDAIDTL